MPKSLSDASFSFADLLPESIKNDSVIQAAANSLDGEVQAVNQILDVPALLSRIDELPNEVLEHLAWQFHVDFWDQDLSLELKRNLIRDSIAWHKYKGTPWAVRAVLDRVGFSDAELIEFWQARQQYQDAGGTRLDGSWTINGSQSLVPYYDIAGLPFMQHWAEFCVKINLAEPTWPNWKEDLVRAVDVAKPARSWPVWLFWLYLEIIAQPVHEYSLYFSKDVPIGYPWCTPQLGRGWKLGSGGYLFSLNGRSLNGAWGLGARSATLAYEQLRQCSIIFDLAFRKYLERPSRHIAARLGESKLFLDGGWQVGLNPVMALNDSVLNKEIDISQKARIAWLNSYNYEIDFPKTPQRLTSRYKLAHWNRINGEWQAGKINRELTLDGSWKVVRLGIATEAIKKITFHHYTGFLKSLSGKLDGVWRVGGGFIPASSLLILSKGTQAGRPVKADSRKKITCGYEISYPYSQNLDRNTPLAAYCQLNSGWALGSGTWGRKLDGWGLQREQSIISDYSLAGTKEDFTGLPARLGRYQKLSRKWIRKLNGHFQIGADYQLDGSWNLAEPFKLSAPRIGAHFWGLDGAWKIGRATKKLSGWPVGWSFGPSTECELTIH